MFSIFYKNDYKIIELLLKKNQNNKQDINITDKNKHSALTYSLIYNKNEKVIGLLLKNKAYVNIIDKDGKSLIMFAVLYKNSFYIKKLLLQKGANVHFSDFR